MSAGLAHEFKNAIATLQGYAQLLENEELLNEVRSLSSMVTAFLNFARPQPLHFEDVSLKELVEDCGTELKLTLDLDESIVRADERMLRQAILNILRNAVEAIPEHGSVFVKVQNQTIEIRDTGPGIPADHLSKIFIPFFTTKPTGHGIGLALAHRIITEHGGTLTAANAPEGGAVFTIRL
jgi:signal transduction histidine kinase